MNRLSACFALTATFALAACNGSSNSVPGPTAAAPVLNALATTRTSARRSIRRTAI